jgi:hypothetical protein
MRTSTMMKQINVENRMVVDSEWAWKEKVSVPAEVEKGYRSFCGNEFVPLDEAFEYAIDKCINGIEADREAFAREFKGEFKEESKDDIVEWFFSGNWVKEE